VSQEQRQNIKKDFEESQLHRITLRLIFLAFLERVLILITGEMLVTPFVLFLLISWIQINQGKITQQKDEASGMLNKIRVCILR